MILGWILVAGNLLALDWQTATDGEFQFVSKTNISEMTQVILTDKANLKITVRYEDSPSAELIRSLVKAKNTVSSIPQLTITGLTVTLMDKNMDLLVRVGQYMYEGQDFTPYLPSGMLFNQSDVLQYNFRMDVNNVFIKVKGEFIGAPELGQKISEALKDPGLYARKRDPEYILSKIEKLETDNSKLQSENNRLRKFLMNQSGALSEADILYVINQKKENPSLDAEMIRMKAKEEGKKISKKQVETILQLTFD